MNRALALLALSTIALIHHILLFYILHISLYSIHRILSKVYARDVTSVSPVALALFGGRLKIYEKHGVATLEGEGETERGRERETERETEREGEEQ